MLWCGLRCAGDMGFVAQTQRSIFAIIDIKRIHIYIYIYMILALTHLHGPFRLQEMCERPAAALAPPGTQPPAVAPTPAAFAAALRCELRDVDARLADLARAGADSAGGQASLLGLEASTRVCDMTKR